MFFFSRRRRHTRCSRDWSSDVCSSDLKRIRARGDKAGRNRVAIIRNEEGRVRHVDVPRTVQMDSVCEVDRKSVVKGKSVDLGGRRIIKKKKRTTDGRY